MGKALMIGAGGVAGVVAHKCCQNPEVFQELCIASRTLSKCDALKKKIRRRQNKSNHSTVKRRQYRRNYCIN